MRRRANQIAIGLAAIAAVLPVQAASAARVKPAPIGVYQVRTLEGAERRMETPAPLRRGTRVQRRARHGGLTYLLRRNALVVLDPTGERERRIPLRGARVFRAQAIAFGRTGDGTDARGSRHLYVLGRGRRGGRGSVVEVGFEYATARFSAVERVAAPFVRSIPTSAYSPSSPDPAGIAYLPAQDRLLISDSEVEEMPLYQGRNLFTTARGSLQGSGTGTSVGWSKEPTGLGYDPNTNTLYVSDDDGDRVVIDRPGADGVHGTKDDVTTRLVTSGFGSGDPEGVEYDPADGRLYICDGADLEVYVWDPVDGTFANGDDVVTSFDVAGYGMRDCEGLGRDASRGTLLAVDPTRNEIYELTRTGSLARIIDVTSIPATRKSLASVTLAPTSDPADPPGRMSYWITDRQLDNNPYPDENDGLLHELLVPGQVPVADAPPSAQITAPAQGASLSGALTVSANAEDDNGVTQVRFLVDGAPIGTDTTAADGWSVPWDTTQTGNGSRTLTAVAVDTAGNEGASAPVTVSVQNVAQNTLAVAVASGADDADELENGTVNRSTGDLELGSDKGVPTTNGLRFAGVQIPRGAQILGASVQFTADELDRNPATITIRAQASDSAPSFTFQAFNVSSRPTTAASASWAVPLWTVFGAAGAEQRTTDISAVVQEVVNRPGWSKGNALALIFKGSGRRTAETFEGGFPPVLNVEFAAP